MEELEEEVGECRQEVGSKMEEVEAYKILVNNLQRENTELRQRVEGEQGLVRRMEV